MAAKKKLRQRKEAAIKKELSIRAWYKKLLAELGCLVPSTEWDVDALLKTCKGADFTSFGTVGQADAGSSGLPQALVWNWRDVSERLARVREQLPRFRRQFGRAMDYWSGLKVLVEDVISIKRGQIDQLRNQLFPTPASADVSLPVAHGTEPRAQAACAAAGALQQLPALDRRQAALQRLESTLGEVHVLESSLLTKARAMCGRGERALKDLPALAMGSQSAAQPQAAAAAAHAAAADCAAAELAIVPLATAIVDGAAASAMAPMDLDDGN